MNGLRNPTLDKFLPQRVRGGPASQPRARSAMCCSPSLPHDCEHLARPPRGTRSGALWPRTTWSLRTSSRAPPTRSTSCTSLWRTSACRRPRRRCTASSRTSRPASLQVCGRARALRKRCTTAPSPACGRVQGRSCTSTAGGAAGALGWWARACCGRRTASTPRRPWHACRRRSTRACGLRAFVARRAWPCEVPPPAGLNHTHARTRTRSDNKLRSPETDEQRAFVEAFDPRQWS